MTGLSSSLNKRIITAVILIPLIVIAIFYLPLLSFGIIAALIFLLAATEWPALYGKQDRFSILLFVAVTLLGMYLFYFIYQSSSAINYLSYGLYTFMVMFWFMPLYWIKVYEQRKKLVTSRPIIIALFGLIIIVFCWLSLNMIREMEHGKWLVLYCLVLIWGADTAAYFTGKKIGRTKLAPNVSPNKTWEGAYGELVWAGIFSLIISLCLPISWRLKFGFIIISIIAVVFSVAGDLIISVFKRAKTIKDTGALLPGHGGLLDRIDSLTAALPVLAVGFMLLGFHQ